MGTCTFCGHSRLYGGGECVRQQCFTIVEDMITSGIADCFLIGNYGDFDAITAAVCLSLKKEYPHIQVCLVLPYYRPHIDDYTKERYARFDCVITPELEDTPPRYRISKCNEYMVDQADIVVAYVKAAGGAATTLAYAKRKHKQIINIEIGRNGNV